MDAKKPRLVFVQRFKRTDRKGPWRKKNVTLTEALARRAEAAADRRRITFSELVCSLIESYVADEEGNKGTGRKRRPRGSAEAPAGGVGEAA